VAQAEGDAQRFRSVLTEYQKAPAVTRDRLYLETMQQIYSNVSKVMVESRTGRTCSTSRWTVCSSKQVRPRQLQALLQRGRATPPVAETNAGQSIDIRSRDGGRTRDREGQISMNRIAVIVVGSLVGPSCCRQHAVRRRPAPGRRRLCPGRDQEVITEPGLKVQAASAFQNVVFLDKRVQTLDSPGNAPIFTAEKKSLIVDWLIKWRIVEPRQFIRNNGVDFRNLESRLTPVVQAAFNEEITRATSAACCPRNAKSHERRARKAGRRREGLRDRDRRRAYQARRLRCRHHRLGLPAHGIRTQAGG
jgi:hypothetical protein